jgi:hypothetical protein
MADALRPVVGQWLKLLQLAYEHKKAEFDDDAQECMRFFDGPYDWLYKPRGPNSGGFDVDEMEMRAPSVRITINKTAELVQLFGPALYHRNPVRKVNPRQVVQPPMSMYPNVQADPVARQRLQQDMMLVQQGAEIDKARAELLEKYLNYTPTPLDLKNNSRWTITEALIKGMGVLWTQRHRPPGATQTWVGSFHDSVDNLLMDPDAAKISDVKWIARRRCRPAWEVAREFNIPVEKLRASPGLESSTQQAAVATDPEQEYKRKQGRTADLIVYWEVYSKMGMGGRLVSIPEQWRKKFDMLGDYVYLVVAESCPNYPLNIPPPLCDLFDEGQEQLLRQALPLVQQQTGWETPYWADNAWPVSFFSFHWRPGKLWPMSHLKPGLGELKFLNWAYSFLAAKVRVSARDFVAIAKSAGEELKEIIKHGSDFTVITLEQALGPINQVVQFLQHPGFNPELYNVIERVTHAFEQRVGLTELMYGMSARQMRSAQEAQIKSDAINVRPDDMANCVEDAMTDVARKEAFAARWHLTGDDVVRVLGPLGAQMWEQLLVPSDPAGVLYQLEYRIEANSARKPNRAQEAENMQQAIQQLFQPLMQYAQMTGDVNPINSLVEDWAKSIDLDASKYMLQPPPPPPPPPPPGRPPGEENGKGGRPPKKGGQP